jgi:hypothetical protein
MNKTVKISFACALIIMGVVALVAWAAFSARYVRRVEFTNLSVAQTQTVSVAFSPTQVRWRAAGELQGVGTLIIPGHRGIKVSGSFSTNGFNDHYETNAAVIFLPGGQPTGTIRMTLNFFGRWYEHLP